MFRPVEPDFDQINILEHLLFVYNYDGLINKISNYFNKNKKIIKKYNKISANNIHYNNIDYIKDHYIVEKNLSYLRNTFEFYKTAKNTSDLISPILYHYSWHYFNSFTNYTFFRWQPEHSKGHGINIKFKDDEINDIEIKFNKKGVFQRTVDTHILLGSYSALLPYIMVIDQDDVSFIKNDLYVLSKRSDSRARIRFIIGFFL